MTLQKPCLTNIEDDGSILNLKPELALTFCYISLGHHEMTSCWFHLPRDKVELIKQVLPKFCNPWDHSCTKSAGSGLKIKLSIQDDSGWFRFLHLPDKLCGLFVGQKNDWVRQATKEVDGLSAWMSNSHDFNNANRLQQHFRCVIFHISGVGCMLISSSGKRSYLKHKRTKEPESNILIFGVESNLWSNLV